MSSEQASGKVPRDKHGHFLKGHSGNPGGRPKRKWFYEAMEAVYEEVGIEGIKKVIKAQLELAESSDAGSTGALRHLIDRWEGPVKQEVEQSVSLESRVHIEDAKGPLDLTKPERPE